MTLIYGFITGILFGFFMQKGRVLRYDKQLGTLRLLDMTILKFMLTAIVVGMAGIQLFYDLGMITKLDIKSTQVGANVLGGLIFGVGWALLGYCPGTQAGALGEGRWDAVWGICGSLLGGGIYAEVYPFMKETVLTWGDFGKITLPQVLGISPWLVIPVFAVAVVLLFRWFEQKGL
ncbi:DUF6691 family protein [Thiovibrio sp. JS02]